MSRCNLQVTNITKRINDMPMPVFLNLSPSKGAKNEHDKRGSFINIPEIRFSHHWSNPSPETSHA